MPTEDHKTQKKIQCWIPLDTWDKVVSLGYTSPTIAVTKAFEKLLEDPREDPRINPLVSLKDPLVSPEIHTGYKENIKALNNEIERLKNVIMDAPDPLELARLQERNEGLKLLLEEKEKRIQEPTQYKEDIGAFANYFKNVDVKQIEAPGEKKKWWKFWR